MAIRLFAPSIICEKHFLSERDSVDGITPEYFEMLKNEMDAMRERDPKGRHRSNQGYGWQSNDGIDTNPIFSKLIRLIKRTMSHEVMPYLGALPGTAETTMHNAWGNINYKMGWNAPHLHNGCFYSGVFYIKADGDEGCLRFIDTHFKVVGNLPPMPRCREADRFHPMTGDLYLFPSGLMHMVEPNTTDKDRYSISFNLETNDAHSGLRFKTDEQLNEENMDNVFEVDDMGKIIHK